MGGELVVGSENGHLPVRLEGVLDFIQPFLGCGFVEQGFGVERVLSYVCGEYLFEGFIAVLEGLLEVVVLGEADGDVRVEDPLQFTLRLWRQVAESLLVLGHGFNELRGFEEVGGFCLEGVGFLQVGL